MKLEDSNNHAKDLTQVNTESNMEKIDVSESNIEEEDNTVPLLLSEYTSYNESYYLKQKEKLSKQFQTLTLENGKCFDFYVLDKIVFGQNNKTQSSTDTTYPKDFKTEFKYSLKLKVDTIDSSHSYFFISNSRYNTSTCFCSEFRSEDALLINSKGEMYLGDLIGANEELCFEESYLTINIELNFEDQKVRIFSSQGNLIESLPIPRGYSEDSEKDLCYLDVNMDKKEIAWKTYHEFFPFYLGITSCDINRNKYRAEKYMQKLEEGNLEEVLYSLNQEPDKDTEEEDNLFLCKFKHNN